MDRSTATGTSAGPLIESLEPRVMLSGDAGAALLPAPSDGSTLEYYDAGMLLGVGPVGGGEDPTGGLTGVDLANGRVLILAESGLLADSPAAVSFYADQLEADGFTTEVQGTVKNASGQTVAWHGYEAICDRSRKLDGAGDPLATANLPKATEQ